MSVTLPYCLTPNNPYGASAGPQVRSINAGGGFPVRFELVPHSPYAGDPEFNSSNLSAWSKQNPGNASTLDANTTVLDHLVIEPNLAAAWFSGTSNTPYVFQVLSGDFDLYAKVRCGPGIGGLGSGSGYAMAGLVAAQDGVPTNFTGIYAADYSLLFRAANSAGAVTDVLGAARAAQLGGHVWVRLRRAGTAFSAFGSMDGKTWTAVTAPAGDPAFGSVCRVGFTGWSSDANQRLACDFIRNWPPFSTASPAIDGVADSGAAGTTWALSTFLTLENEYKEFAPTAQIGVGTLAYQYGAADVGTPALNGTWLNWASMLMQPDATGRYFRLAVQFNSASGYEQASWSGAQLQATLATGGGVAGGALVLG